MRDIVSMLQSARFGLLVSVFIGIIFVGFSVFDLFCKEYLVFVLDVVVSMLSIALVFTDRIREEKYKDLYSLTLLVTLAIVAAWDIILTR